MAKGKTSKIMACLNTQPSEIKALLNRKNVNFELILDSYRTIPEDQKNTIFGFVSIEALTKNMPYLEKPPILWESVCVLSQIKVTYPIVILDGKMLKDGLVHFYPLDKEKLKKGVKKKFSNNINLYVEKRNPVQLGNDSELSRLVNKFVATLPEYVYESFYVALTSAFQEDDYSILNNFVKENRLLTNENKKEYKELASYIESIKDAISACVNKDTNTLQKMKKDRELKKSISRVRFFIYYFGGANLEDYMDKEQNVANNLS